MKVVFRVDAAADSASHLLRCLILAEVLRERGAEAYFICRKNQGNWFEPARRQAMQIAVLPALTTSAGDSEANESTVWPSASQAEDADQTIEALGDDHPDWLIVDHYRIDARWEQKLRSRTASLMVIDDLENRAHDCNLLTDHSYSNTIENRYRGLVPNTCRLLLGPRYALLRPEYAGYRSTAGPREGGVGRMLVFFGESDPDNMTGMALEAISKSEFHHLEVDVVLAANNAFLADLKEAIDARPFTNLHGPRLHVADLMTQSDLAIGSGGSVIWELMCLGVPSLVVSVTENQKPVCEALSRAGLIRYLGDQRQVRISDLSDALTEEAENRERLVGFSTRGQLTVDGLGALRLAEYLDPTPAESLRLRPARKDDIGLYFAWTNDREVRRQAFHSEPISLNQHRQWFAVKLAESRSHLFVMEARKLPVGQIRFDQDGGELRIDYSVDASFRGRGWAKQLVALGVERMRGRKKCETFRAEVKGTNAPSRAVFSRLGFAESPSPGDYNLRIFLLDPSTHQLSD